MNRTPTITELDCEAVLAVDMDAILQGEAPVPSDVPAHGGAGDVSGPPPAFPKPDWIQPRDRREKRKKKDIGDRVINKDLGHNVDSGTFAKKKAVKATRAEDLTEGQVYMLFEQRLHFGHPADLCRSQYQFEATAADRDYLEWACGLWAPAWLAHLAAWYTVPDGMGFTEVLADFRRQFAERDPVRGRFYAICGRVLSGELVLPCREYTEAMAEVADLRERELADRMRRLGMREESVTEWMGKAMTLEKRNLKGHTDS